MRPRYRELLDQLRREFPQPVSDPVHDAYVAFSVLRALDRVDALKTQAPILGAPVEPDFAAALASRVAQQGEPLEQVISDLIKHLEGMFVWGHPRSQINVISHPSIASIIGVMLASMYNPNLVSDESGRGFSAAEVRATAMAAEMVGYDAAKAGGVFTFGGTGGMLYGVKVGLEKAVPGCLRSGLTQPAVVLASAQSHACTSNVSAWLGIGQDNVLLVPTENDHAVDLALLGETARQALRAGKRLAAIVATMGSTDAFGIDDLFRIHALRETLIREFSLDYSPHIHADAVVGWAWSVFNDYDFLQNSLGFRGRTVRALAKAHHRIHHLGLADSIGIDFHKTGFAPYISSLVIFRDRDDLQHILRPARIAALFVSVRRAPSRAVHAGNEPQRDRPDGGAGKPVALGQRGLSHAAGARRRNGRSAARGVGRAPRSDGAERGERRPGDAVPRLSARHGYVHDQRAGALGSEIPGTARRAESLQPPSIRARAGRGAGRRRRRDLDDRRLHPQRFRHADHGAKVVRSLPLHRRGADARSDRARACRPAIRSRRLRNDECRRSECLEKDETQLTEMRAECHRRGHSIRHSLLGLL